MFDKLDAYNLVANLVPGAALIYALNYSNFPTPSPNEIGAFLLVSFVVGVTTNRIGSLLVDPALRSKKWGFLHPKNYKAFVESEKRDSKLETIVANHGLYRTFFTAGLIYFLALALNRCLPKTSDYNDLIFMGFLIAGMVVFLFALKKEDDYIQKRIEKSG